MYTKTYLFTLLCLLIQLMPLLSYSQACDSVKLKDFPVKDLPTSADRVKLQKEESYKYYYGVGVPVDYVKARKLAFFEWEGADNYGPFEGPGIILMLYANGYGVKRNLDICIRLACANIGGAPAEVEFRVQHLKALKGNGPKEIFDVCDDATSGYMSGWCQSIQSELAGIKRKAAIQAIVEKWPKQDQVAFAQLKAMVSDFFSERVEQEVDMSGTARVMIALQESDSLEDNFLHKIEAADKCKFSNYTEQDYASADKELNVLYKKVMGLQEFVGGTVTKEGIKATQRAWIGYRDAWVAFGAIRCPKVGAVTWKMMITLDRIEQLKEFADD